MHSEATNTNATLRTAQKGGEGEKEDDGGKGEQLRLRLEINLDIEIQLKAKIHGDLTIGLLYVSPLLLHLLFN